MNKNEVYTYDLETYPNIFTCSVKHLETGDRRTFEISDRKNETADLARLLGVLSGQSSFVGFNNEGFDYPILHFFMQDHMNGIDHTHLYTKAMQIIKGDSFRHTVWPDNRYIRQIDLFKINHFDNVARSTSLKMLEFNMRSANIEDLPFPVGTILTDDQKDVLIHYNEHDVDETEKFLLECWGAIDLRTDLSQQYETDFTNHNDTKIGKDIFIMKLEQNRQGVCWDYSSGRKQPRQTHRPQIHLRDVILPQVEFVRPEFNNVLNRLRSTTITETKGVFEDMVAVVDGFHFVFGLGGIHGSVDPCIVRSDDDHVIIDLDVTSYYPSLAISNNIYPAHLGELFVDIYSGIKAERVKHDKKSPISKALKLALNGVYGDSNNQYSPFYDPQYTMTITINGQLLLCMLAEWLMTIDGLQMIQINTDGLTVKVPRDRVDIVMGNAREWEKLTGLELEDVNYKAMYIRDVNNYIGGYEDGSLKRKGAYEYKREWHQNHSMLIVPKAAEAALVYGVPVATFIRSCVDIYDFCKRVKVPRASHLVMVDSATQQEQPCQNITRYIISNNGGDLVKVMPAKGPVGEYKRNSKCTDAEYHAILQQIPPGAHDERIHTKNKSRYEERRSFIEKGFLCNECNDIASAQLDDINYNYYISEAEKIVKPLLYGKGP